MAVIMVLAAGLSYTYKAAAPAIAPQIDAENTPIYTAAEPQPEPEFVEAFVYDMALPLAPDLQEHTWELSQRYSVPYEIIMAIIWHESRYVWPGEVIDTNGLPSVGYMQINQPHWQRLTETYGLDVHDERDNIEAGAVILAELLEKYPLEKALVAYQCGESGAKGIESTAFSREILEISTKQTAVD